MKWEREDRGQRGKKMRWEQCEDIMGKGVSGEVTKRGQCGDRIWGQSVNRHLLNGHDMTNCQCHPLLNSTGLCSVQCLFHVFFYNWGFWTCFLDGAGKSIMNFMDKGLFKSLKWVKPDNSKENHQLAEHDTTAWTRQLHFLFNETT